VEDALLAERPAQEKGEELDPLGELGEELQGAAREDLIGRLRALDIPAQSQVFRAGDAGSEIHFVQEGRITLSTALEGGLRLATVGRGQAFGEMAFLNGIARTAHALTLEQPARLLVLARDEFDAWAQQYPDEALVFMSRLAQVGIRRLGLTTRQLRAVLE